MNKLPKDYYDARIAGLEHLLSVHAARKNKIGWARFAVAVCAILSIFFLRDNPIWIPATVFGLFAAIFLRLVAIDLKNNALLKNIEFLIHLNKEELKIAEHHFTHREEGLGFIPNEHEYAGDLDIFGRASLFQYINRSISDQGKQKLADWLLNSSDATVIAKRQESVKELAAKTEWRQQLQAYGMTDNITISTEERLNAWIQETDDLSKKPIWNFLRFIIPLLACTSLALFALDVIEFGPFVFIVIFFFIVASRISNMIMPMYEQLNRIAGEIETLSTTAGWIEEGTFQSSLLIDIQKTFSAGDQKASTDIRHLKRILERFDLRLNPLVFFPLNTFFLWDLQQAFALEKWKKEHRDKIPAWFQSLGEIEALNSMGALCFNHPNWCFPEFAEEPGTFIAEDLGHPLIETAKLVCNSFSTTGVNKLNLITGSNMAGKSTFLRSVGINIVLAMAGAPTYAKSVTLFPMKVMSSMRISDNLEESTSTFYAELKKLKRIIEAVNNQEKIFILLDEILRGTNSNDRHAGSKALIKQLIHHKAAGLIATHDLELTKLTEEFPENIHNYHFDVQVADDELYFDYKLKEGICRSLNASILMRKIGIEL